MAPSRSPQAPTSRAPATLSGRDSTPSDSCAAPTLSVNEVPVTEGTSGTLTFAAGTTTRAGTGVVNGDTTDELLDETFLVNLSNPINATISDGRGLGAIRNDDSDEIFADGFETGATTAWSATVGEE